MFTDGDSHSTNMGENRYPVDFDSAGMKPQADSWGGECVEANPV